MTSTDILTFGQGITILIQTATFIFFFYIYHIIYNKNLPLSYIIFTSVIFMMWLLSITVGQNIILALNIPLSS